MVLTLTKSRKIGDAMPTDPLEKQPEIDQLLREISTVAEKFGEALNDLESIIRQRASDEEGDRQNRTR